MALNHNKNFMQHFLFLISLIFLSALCNSLCVSLFFYNLNNKKILLLLLFQFWFFNFLIHRMHLLLHHRFLMQYLSSPLSDHFIKLLLVHFLTIDVSNFSQYQFLGPLLFLKIFLIIFLFKYNQY
jgi:hypothetical protein